MVLCFDAILLAEMAAATQTTFLYLRLFEYEIGPEFESRRSEIGIAIIYKVTGCIMRSAHWRSLAHRTVALRG